MPKPTEVIIKKQYKDQIWFVYTTITMGTTHETETNGRSSRKTTDSSDREETSS